MAEFWISNAVKTGEAKRLQLERMKMKLLIFWIWPRKPICTISGNIVFSSPSRLVFSSRNGFLQISGGLQGAFVHGPGELCGASSLRSGRGTRWGYLQGHEHRHPAHLWWNHEISAHKLKGKHKCLFIKSTPLPRPLVPLEPVPYGRRAMSQQST